MKPSNVNFPMVLPKFNQYSFAVMMASEPNLLQHQLEALRLLQNWFKPNSDTSTDVALVSMPTGSGKTGVMCCLPYFLASIGMDVYPDNTPHGTPSYLFDKPVLVIAPDLTIAKQLEEQFSVPQAGHKDTFLIRRQIVPLDRQRYVVPLAKKIEETNELTQSSSLEGYDVIIANAQKFLGDRWEDALPDNLFRLVIVDEAHHHPAKTWQRIVQKFQSKALVVFFTATPYRSDRKKVLEKTPITYRLKLEDAVIAGIIRRTQFEELDSSVDVVFRNREALTTEEITDMGRKASILARVKEVLLMKNGNEQLQLPDGVPHMAMAIASDTVQADRLLDLWKTLYADQLPAETYHSQMPKHEKQSIMAKLKKNEISLLIVVAMLLEGFDHPPVSIAAITYKIGSPVKFVQFIGRAQRIYRGVQGIEENGIADIITHVSYEQRQNYKNFIDETLIPEKDQN